MKKLNRIMAATVACLMILALAGGIASPAHADEIGYTDPYVCVFDGSVIEGYEEYSLPLMYVTPHNMDLYVYAPNAGYSKSLGEANAQVFNLVNTTAITAEGGEGAYASIPAYCTDMLTGTVENVSYQRINLENSSFYNDVAAQKIRAIVLNSFPCVSLQELEAAVNDARGEDSVTDLSGAEAILATQYSIWMLANAKSNFNPGYPGGVYLDQDKSGAYSNTVQEGDNAWQSYTSFYEGDVLYPDGDVNMYEIPDEHTDANIEAVAAYLRGLEPVKANRTVVANENIKLGRVDAQKNEDGGYTLTLEYELLIDLAEEDELELRVTYGDTGIAQVVALNSDNLCGTVSMIVPDKEQIIKVEVNGYQIGSDVYFFEAFGGVKESQSMVGYDDSRLPVHAEKNASAADRVVTIHKTDDTEERNGLENIAFDFYYVCSVDAYLSNEVTLGTGIVTIDGRDYFSSPTAEDIAKYVTGTTPVVSVVTDANGNAVHNFGTNNDGIYLVVEQENPAIATVAKPFFVAVPGGAEADSGLCKIEIQPKNTVKNEDIEIEKDVTSINNEHSTYDVGQEHAWIIQSSIPTGIGSGLKYAVSDTLDERLTLVAVDRVAIAKDAGSFGSSEEEGYVRDENETPAFDESEIVLTEDVHYTVSIAEDNSGFVMSLTADGMAYVAEQVGEACGDYEIRTYFTAVINTNAGMGENIPNKAHVDYTNNVGKDYDADSDIPEVHTGGINLVKVDASNGQKLAGAKFTLNILNEDGTYTPVAFYNNAAMTGEKVTEVVTDANGNAVFYGLAYGTYYLIETEAPEGYNLLSEPVAVPVNAFTHLTENAVTVKNSAEFRLPETGGIGTALFTFGGSGIIGAAALVLLGGKKKRR